MAFKTSRISIGAVVQTSTGIQTSRVSLGVVVDTSPVTTTDGAGSAVGAGAASGTGAATAASAGSSAGLAAVAGVGVGRVTTSAVGSAAGVAATSGVAGGTVAGKGVANGVAKATGKGSVPKSAAGSATATSRATAIGSYLNPGVGVAAAAATGAGKGKSLGITATIGAATAAGVAAAEGATTPYGIGTAVAQAGAPVPEVSLDFARSQWINDAKGYATLLTLPGYTYTRAGTKSELDASGAPVSFAANAPGVIAGYGYYSREATTNLIFYSQQMNNATWSKGRSTVTADAIAAPDGTMTADAAIEDTSTGQHYLSNTSSAVVSGLAYTTSVFAKWNGRHIGIRTLVGASNLANAVFDLQNGLVQSASIGTATIENCGGGWYRCSATGVAGASGTAQVLLEIFDSSFTYSHTGDAVSGFYAWQAQVVAGSDPGPLIVTTSAAVTTGADSLTIATNNDNYIATYTFDDGSQQTIATVVAGGAFALPVYPTTLNRPVVAQFKLRSVSAVDSVSGVGQMVNGGAGAASAISAASGAGMQLMQAVAASSGAGTASGVGQLIAESTAFAVASSIVSATGAYMPTEAIGQARGTARVDAAGTGVRSSVATSASTGGAIATTNATHPAVASAAATSSVSGASTGYFIAVGAASGTSVAAAVGVMLSESVGACVGVITAAGVGVMLGIGVGAAAASSSGAAQSTGTSASVGSSAASGAASGAAVGFTSASGAASAGSTAGATGSATAAGRGSAAGIALAAVDGERVGDFADPSRVLVVGSRDRVLVVPAESVLADRVIIVAARDKVVVVPSEDRVADVA